MFQELGAQCRQELKSKVVSLICIPFGKYDFVILPFPKLQTFSRYWPMEKIVMSKYCRSTLNR